MSKRFRHLGLAFLSLMVLLAIEAGGSFLPFGQSARPVVLIPAALMAVLVGVVFMEAGRGPGIVRLFVAASLLWLSILLGLGSLDPLTRALYRVEAPV